VTHRRLLRVRTEEGREAVARPARRELSIVCGDFVRCELDARHDELNVVAVEPRTSALYRTNARGGSELIAANLSLLLVVVAPLPRPDFFVVDRYLCAAQCGGLAAAVVLNKSELPIEADIEQELAAYGAAGYRCLRVSAQQQTALDALLAWLPQRTAMLVGQSGVGKSSLLRKLVPDSDVPIGELIRDDEGRHTTTATRLYEVPGGGEIIDSPGVRDFAPAIDRLERSDLGFLEIEQLAAQCRFADCRHMHEPDCAVRTAVGTALSARRYESYRRLRRLYERLSAERLAAGDRRRR
jgi:ribosome biogenesis GTPase / thiamine phosphate phosphatase